MKNFSLNSKKVFSSAAPGKTVILDSEENRFFYLEGTGQELWDLVVTGANYENLVTWLIEKYELSEESAQKDVADFLGQLKEEGLIQLDG